MTTWQNWAGTAQAEVTVARPASVAELRRVVAEHAAGGRRIKPIGAGHSFTAIGVTDGTQLVLDRLSGIVHADRAAGQVTVLAGTPLHRLNAALWALGLSLSNLGDIDVQTIAGALATGTHGTGARYGGLATQVRALDLVRADGSLLHCSADDSPDVFAAACVGLGALGVVATVTLQCEPAFALHAVEEPDDLDRVVAALPELVAAHDHVEFYWFPHTRRVLTKRNDRRPLSELAPLPAWRRRLDDELLANTVFEGVNRLTTRRPALVLHANRLAARALTARTYVDRSYRVFTSPRTVRFRESEWAVPQAAIPDVLAGVEKYLERSGEQVGFPVEVRVAATDDRWLSTAYGRDTGYVAVHQYRRRDHTTYFRAVEAIARDVGGRPHWGKLHDADAAYLAEAYPRFADFRAVRDRLDPDRVFGNDYLTRVLGR